MVVVRLHGPVESFRKAMIYDNSFLSLITNQNIFFLQNGQGHELKATVE